MGTTAVLQYCNKGIPMMRSESDVAAQRLSDNNQKSSAPKIFAVVRRDDVLSNAIISVTKPPWLLSKTVGSERL